ncbi:MAG: hypothetical protein ABID63_17250 [Pseudomonadota bacterium]
MTLVRITDSNVDAFITFLKAHLGDEGRDFLGQIDARALFLKRSGDYFCLQGDTPCATVSVSRTDPHDGDKVIGITIIPASHNDGTLIYALNEFLKSEAQGPDSDHARLYQILDTPENPLPADDLRAAGFTAQPGRRKYLRDPGPPRPGEFPMADKALARGYRIVKLSPEMVAQDPDIFTRLAGIHTHIFAGKTGARAMDADDMRACFNPPGGIVLALLEGEITGYMTYLPMKNEVLASECASLRRHWGSGSADAMCRYVAQIVADQWNLPIAGFGNARNAAACKVMERSGMRRIADYPVWEYRVSAGLAP